MFTQAKVPLISILSKQIEHAGASGITVFAVSMFVFDLKYGNIFLQERKKIIGKFNK